MKVFVTGVNGQLGYDVIKELVKRGHEVIASGRGEKYSGILQDDLVTNAPYVQLDITDRNAVMDYLRGCQPEAVVHCAAWTAVDAAEDIENIEQVFSVNANGTENVALAAKSIDAKMVYFSTDYVFDGRGTEPRKPDQIDFRPLSVYGQSKLDGEFAVCRTLDKYFIIRIAWVFGANGNNFIKTMIRAGKSHDSVRVVNDQIGTPTYTKDLARLTVDMVETEKYGFYHATNEGGYISWYDFCKEIYAQSGLATEVIGITTEEYGLSKAVRPFNSRLDKTKLIEEGFELLPDWRDALKRFLKEVNS